jgi:hypothetical protein
MLHRNIRVHGMESVQQMCDPRAKKIGASFLEGNQDDLRTPHGRALAVRC